MLCAFIQNASPKLDSFFFFFKGGLSHNYYSSSGFERQSRVIEFSVDECYIKDLQSLAIRKLLPRLMTILFLTLRAGAISCLQDGIISISALNEHFL